VQDGHAPRQIGVLRQKGAGRDARTGRTAMQSGGAMTPRIVLRGMNGAARGQRWESSGPLRIGRLGVLEVTLPHDSVSRIHAEVRLTERGWWVEDLGSTNGTRLNGVRLGSGRWPLRTKDLIQFGEVAVVVESANDPTPLDRLASAEGPDEWLSAFKAA